MEDEIKKYEDKDKVLQLYIYELLGTFMIVLFGSGSMGLATMSYENTPIPEDKSTGIGLVHMIVYSIFIYATSGHCKCTFNPVFWGLGPVITLVKIIRGRFRILTGIIVIAIQFLASVLAALTLKFLIGGTSADLGAPEMKGVSYIQGFFMEFIGAVFLQLVYLYFVENENAPENADGFSVGAMFGMCILSTNYFTGAAINPARALGPLILSLKFWLIPLYLFAPIVGSICGYLIYSYMLLELDTEISINLRAKKSAEKAQEQEQEERAKQIFNLSAN